MAKNKAKANTKIVYVCPQCESQDVQEMVWIKSNTEEAIRDEVFDYWCESCSEHIKKLNEIEVKQ